MEEVKKLGVYNPKRVQLYHDYLQQGLPENVFIKYRRAYIRNICYGFQYLEYLNFSLTQALQHVVIENQFRKSFIITGCGIVESILWMVLKGNELNSQTEWEEIQRRETNRFKEGADEYKFEIAYYRKTKSPSDLEMKSIDMCRKTEKKKLLGVTSDVYAMLNHLRKLRNRVHLHSVQHDRDNDFWVFEQKDIDLMKSVLVSILQSQIFDPCPDFNKVFSWLIRNMEKERSEAN